MSNALGFRIVRTPYPAASKMTGVVVQKVRDDGRAGPVVGDEATLWDALQQAEGRIATMTSALDQQTAATIDAEKRVEEVSASYASSRKVWDEQEAKCCEAQEALRSKLQEADQREADMLRHTDHLKEELKDEMQARLAAEKALDELKAQIALDQVNRDNEAAATPHKGKTKR